MMMMTTKRSGWRVLAIAGVDMTVAGADGRFCSSFGHAFFVDVGSSSRRAHVHVGILYRRQRGEPC